MFVVIMGKRRWTYVHNILEFVMGNLRTLLTLQLFFIVIAFRIQRSILFGTRKD